MATAQEVTDRYGNFAQILLDIISESEGTDRLDLVPEGAKSIIETPYDMVANYGRSALPPKKPTEMTINEVIKFGRTLVNKTPNNTSAMGKYQILANSFGKGSQKVLEEYANKLKLNKKTQLFTPEIQDQIALKMLEDKVPSLKKYVNDPTDKNFNTLLDETNNTWRGVPDSKGRTSEGQNVGPLSVDDIKSKMIIKTDSPMKDQMETVFGGAFSIDEDGKVTNNEAIDEAESISTSRDFPPGVKERKPLIPKESEPIFKRKENDPVIDIPSPFPAAEASEVFDPNQMPDVENSDDKTETPKAGPAELGSQRSPNEKEEREEIQEYYDKQKLAVTGDLNYPDFQETENEIDETDASDLKEIGVGEFLANLLSSDDTDDFFEDEPMPMGGEADPRDERDDVIMNFEEGGEVKADFDGKDEEEEEDAKDPPPGATPEQVADDIPAFLSEGEYVLPANVVNHVGVKNIAKFHQDVLDEIQQMTELGLIPNVDENGKKEVDNDEMPKVKSNGEVVKQKEPKVEKATLIIASSKPKGMMCNPLMMDVGGEADPKSEDETSGGTPQGPDDVSGEVGSEVDIGVPERDLSRAGVQADFASLPSVVGFLANRTGLPDMVSGLMGLHETGMAAREKARDKAKEKGEDPNMSFSIPGISEEEDMAFYGNPEGPNFMGDDITDMEPTIGTLVLSDAEEEAEKNKDPDVRTIKVEQFIPGVGIRGIMAPSRSPFNTGGFVPDVGIVPFDMGMNVADSISESLFDFDKVLEKTQSNDPTVYGFKSWDEARELYESNPVLKGQELADRQNVAKYVTKSSLTYGPDDSSEYLKDPYIRLKMNEFGVPNDQIADVMTNFRKGYTDLGVGTVGNVRLANDLTAYANEKRINRFGFTEQDLSNLRKASDDPDNLTVRDAVKLSMRTQLQNQDPSSKSAGEEYNEGNRDLKRRILLMGGDTFEPEFMEKLNLDAPANLEDINKVNAFLNTRDKSKLDSKDIFKEFSHIEHLSPENISKARKEQLGNFIPGVGYT